MATNKNEKGIFCILFLFYILFLLKIHLYFNNLTQVLSFSKLNYFGVFFLQVQIPGLENLQIFVPDTLSREKSVILQLLDAAAGKDCSKYCDEVAGEPFLLMTKYSDKEHEIGDSWSTWEGQPVKIMPQVETIDTLRSMQVNIFCFSMISLCGGSSLVTLIDYRCSVFYVYICVTYWQLETLAFYMFLFLATFQSGCWS